MALWFRRLQAPRAERCVVLRFVPRSSGKPLLAFPCNPAGEVQLDKLSRTIL